MPQILFDADLADGLELRLEPIDVLGLVDRHPFKDAAGGEVPRLPAVRDRRLERLNGSDSLLQVQPQVPLHGLAYLHAP